MTTEFKRRLILNRRKFITITAGLISSPVIAKAGSLQLLGAGKAIVSAGSTTLFTASPSLNADDANPNISFRVCCPITGNSVTQIRVTFQPASAGSLVTSHCSIGKRDVLTPAQPNTTLMPNELLFGGVSGFNTTSGLSVTSDWLTLSDFALNNGDEAVVIFDGTSPATQRYNNANVGVVSWFQGGASWNISNVTGLGFSNVDNTNYSIVSIETQ